MKKVTFTRTLREIQRHMPGGRMLDVGTATGFFLEVAQRQGFEPYGVEISEYAGQIAASKFPPGHIHIGTLETAPFEDATFSVIAMSDLLEHVADPIRTLQLARRMLAPDGVVAITTPNTASLSRRLMGPRWTHYKLEHLFYWNPESIQVVTQMAGYKVIAVKPARKTVTPEYVRAQMSVYPHWLLTPVSRLAKTALGPLAAKPVTFTMGDMLVLLTRIS